MSKLNICAYFFFTTATAAFSIGCGTTDSGSASGKLSQIAVSGNFVMGLTSCAEGQFDPNAGSDFLTQNRLISDLAKDNLKVTAKISSNEFWTSAPSTFFGAGNKGCVVTTISSLSYPSDHSMSLKAKSRACSGTCSTQDCKEEKVVASSVNEIFDYTFDGSKLLMTVNASKDACVLNGKKSAPRLLFSK